MVPPNMTDPCPGYRHHPMADWADEAYFKGLTAERKKLEFVKGRRVYRWECPKGVRNEPLDCRNIARACAGLVGIDRYKAHQWDDLAAQVVPKVEKSAEVRGGISAMINKQAASLNAPRRMVADDPYL